MRVGRILNAEERKFLDVSPLPISNDIIALPHEIGAYYGPIEDGNMGLSHLSVFNTYLKKILNKQHIGQKLSAYNVIYFGVTLDEEVSDFLIMLKTLKATDRNCIIVLSQATVDIHDTRILNARSIPILYDRNNEVIISFDPLSSFFKNPDIQNLKNTGLRVIENAKRNNSFFGNRLDAIIMIRRIVMGHEEIISMINDDRYITEIKNNDNITTSSREILNTLPPTFFKSINYAINFADYHEVKNTHSNMIKYAQKTGRIELINKYLYHLNNPHLRWGITNPEEYEEILILHNRMAEEPPESFFTPIEQKMHKREHKAVNLTPEEHTAKLHYNIQVENASALYVALQEIIVAHAGHDTFNAAVQDFMAENAENPALNAALNAALQNIVAENAENIEGLARLDEALIALNAELQDVNAENVNADINDELVNDMYR
ncbi:hypothetical protein GUI12_01705 [Anaplasmataceae bacterium AB001_6]|nr:hypothetical protein GUI12_01705 [Anaplasmataceae bacterium AB001_6]